MTTADSAAFAAPRPVIAALSASWERARGLANENEQRAKAEERQ